MYIKLKNIIFLEFLIVLCLKLNSGVPLEYTPGNSGDVDKNELCTKDSDCMHGGTCPADGSMKICSCPPGTKGNLCETVSNCNSLDCGSEADCIYDKNLQKGKCKCKDESLTHDEDDKKCKKNFCPEICGNNPGVNCEGEKTEKIKITCSCKEKNEIFDEKDKTCKKNFCPEMCGSNPGVNCHGEKTDKSKITCSCKEKSKIFDGKDKTCKINMCPEICGNKPGVKCEGEKTVKEGIKCSCEDENKVFSMMVKECKGVCKEDTDCRNGGTCKEEGPLKFCSCLQGTEGSFCEKVPACEKLDCGANASCMFVIETKATTCQCKDSKRSFDSQDKKCKTTCNDDGDCKNGGSCKENGTLKTCSCIDDTEGPFCEKVLSCEKLDCGTDAICAFNTETKAAVCQCKDLKKLFDPQDKLCKIVCSDDKDCKNGGICEENGSLKTCSCREGTEGPFCEKILSCKDLDCGIHAKCELDSETEAAICQCKDDKLSFDEKDKKCKLNKCKEVCGTEFGRKDHVLCEGDPFGDKNVTCNCRNKTMDFFPKSKSCKVNKCKEKCGLNLIKVLCVGEPFGEGEVSCSCKDESFRYLANEKDCQKIPKLSFFSTFAIALSVMVAFVLIVAAIVFCRKRFQQPWYTLKFRDRTISFESALYDANNETLLLYGTRN